MAVYQGPDAATAPWPKKLALLDEVTGILQAEKVDLVVLNEAPSELAYRVLREGRLLSCREQQPMRDLFFAHLSQRVKEGLYGR